MPIQVSFRSAIFVALAALTLLISGCRSTPQQADRPQLADGVVMRDVTFYSNALRKEMPYRVFLPASLQAGQSYPVVYLLHGNGGGFRDWSNDSNVARYASAGMILVMPEGKSSYYLNATGSPQDKYEDYLTRDLIQDVEGRFAALKGREHRAIIGVSMGGFAALKLALSRSELYVFAGAISPPVDVPQRRFTWKRAGQWLEFRRIFGPMDSQERKARDPFALVASADPNATPYIFLSSGLQEPLREPIERFESQLKRRGFQSEFIQKSGGHDWGEWNAQIPECFLQLTQHLKITPHS